MAKGQLNRRQFLQMTGSTLGLAALAACVPAAPPAAAPQTAGDGAPSVSAADPLWVLHSQDFHPGYNEFIRQTIVSFAEERGYPLEVADTAGFLGGSADIQKITASVQSGDSPDLWMHTVNVFQMHQLGNVVPVTDIVEEIIGMYGELAVRQQRDTIQDGEYVAVPFHVRSDGGWARTDVFEPAGIDINAIKTFEELREACMEVSDPTSNMWGWGMTINRSGDGGYLVNRVTTGYGSYWTDETGQYVTINSPETVDAINFLVDTYTNPQWERMMPPGILSWTDPTNNEVYLAGQIAYTQNGGTLYAQAVFDENPVADVTIFDPPKGGPVNETFQGLGSMNWLMIQGGKNPDAARELILHFFEEENLSRVYEVATSYAIPAYENMWEWDVITSVPNTLVQKAAALDPIGWNGIAYPGPSSAAIGAVGAANIHTDMIASVINGEATPEEAAAQAARRAIQIFQEFGMPGEM